VPGGGVIHKLAAAAAVPAWKGPLRKLMNNSETDIRAAEGSERVSSNVWIIVASRKALYPWQSHPSKTVSNPLT